MTIGKELWGQAILPLSATIKEVIANLDRVSLKIVMIVNSQNELEGTVSDGDIRRGLLRGLTLESPVSSVVHRNPLVVPQGMSKEAVVQLMLVNKVQQIPVVDDDNHIIGLHLWEVVLESPTRSNLMVIMAGGKGVRLRPYTESCPKPMVEVAGRPMLAHIIERAKTEGFSRFIIAVHYLGHLIEEHFGNGEAYDVEITYVREQKPLGTAGALSLLESMPDEPFIVTNGDVITDIRYGELLDFLIKHNASGTMAVRSHEWQHPFGVVHTKGVEIIGFDEKPIYRSYINAGVYSFQPESLKLLKKNCYCDMPTFFELIKSSGLQTIAYPMHEPWLDVGRPEDLKIAHQNLLEEK